MSKTSLTDPKLAIILAYAPAGLGHLRVTDAFRHGLPKTATPILLSAREESIRMLHRLSSVNPVLLKLMEWVQRGRPQAIMTRVYRRLILSDAYKMEEQLFDIYKQRVELPTGLLVIASHFGIAHQVGKIKKHLEGRIGIPVYLVVQVTDDSPQSIWYVPGADLISVPSESTRQELISYGERNHLPVVKFVVNPYPISSELSEDLTENNFKFRELQYKFKSNVPIHMLIPVSGAAVGITYAMQLVSELRRKSKRFQFHIVAKRNVFTDMFVGRMEQKSYVQTYTSHSDRQIVELYETAYAQAVIGFEVTKPSEQAFKALLSVRQKGGSVLLFTDPVGRQEYDNLAFLRRHLLIPTLEEQQSLFEAANAKRKISETEFSKLYPGCAGWRGLSLPIDAATAAKFVIWAIEQGLFGLMRDKHACRLTDEACSRETGSNGVTKFWHEVDLLLKG